VELVAEAKKAQEAAAAAEKARQVELVAEAKKAAQEAAAAAEKARQVESVAEAKKAQQAAAAAEKRHEKKILKLLKDETKWTLEAREVSQKVHAEGQVDVRKKY
jgi:hypothetical protein